MAMGSLETDYLVDGAGAMVMAFTDALIDHADVHVTLVDRRYAAGGHWHDAYPFVPLHKASLFYGVASTVLGPGAGARGDPRSRRTTPRSSTGVFSARDGSRSSARASTAPTGVITW